MGIRIYVLIAVLRMGSVANLGAGDVKNLPAGITFPMKAT
jgi:hypothetical protein